MVALPVLPLNLALFRPGMRVAVAVSGGADSVALLCALLRLLVGPPEDRLGLVLSVIHVHHGIRGAEADADAEFVRALASRCDLPFHLHRVDTPSVARVSRQTIEQAARQLRYACFDSVMTADEADAVATAHTLDDQAETVMHRFLRGAWTEGLGGIHPLVVGGKQPGSRELTSPDTGQNRGSNSGAYLRPLLGARRREVEAYLIALGQPWRTDSSNSDTAFTRNRIRGELMPLLRTYNPQVDSQLAKLSAIARDEEDYWSAELARLLPSLLLPGKPVRGGGRAAGTDASAVVFAIEIERLRALAPAVRRRVLRAAAARLDHSLSFDHTEALLALCGLAPAVTMEPTGGAAAKHSGSAASGEERRPGLRRLDLSVELRVDRTPRELRFTRRAANAPPPAENLPEYALDIPGEVSAEYFGLIFRSSADGCCASGTIRACRPGDRATLKHSSGPKTIKEILERLHLSASDRARWPLVEWQGEVIWMRGVEVESAAAFARSLTVSATDI